MSIDPLFRMTVEDVFSIRGRGTVAVGKIEAGTLKSGDRVWLQHAGANREVTVAGIEMFRKVMDQAGTGDNVGLLLKDLNQGDIQRGDVLLGSGEDFSWKA